MGDKTIEELLNDIDKLNKRYKWDLINRKSIAKSIMLSIGLIDLFDTTKLVANDKKIVFIKKSISKRIKYSNNLFNMPYKYNEKYEETYNFLKELYSLFDNNSAVRITGINMQEKYVVNLIDDFLDNIDDELSLIFKRMMEQERIIFVKDKEINDFCVAIKQLKKSYLFITKNKTLSFPVNTVHELGHAFEYELSNYKKINKNNLYYVEVIPLFMELLFLEYIKHNPIYSPYKDEFKDYSMKLDYVNIKCILSDLELVIKVNRYLNDLKYDNKTKSSILSDNEKIKKILELRGIIISDEEINNLRNNNSAHNLVYITNKLIALELFDIYQKDKDGAIEILKYLCKNTDKDPILNFNNINLNHNFSELIPLYKKYIIAEEKQDEKGIEYTKIS